MPSVPVCPSCRAPIYSAKPNALLGNILLDYFAEYPEKRNSDICSIGLGEATAICNDLLELYSRGMIIATRETDGLIVCMMERVSQEQYERHRSEYRGAGMIWSSHGGPSSDTLPRTENSPPLSAANIPLIPEQPINEGSAHTEHPENMSVHNNIQRAGMASELTPYHHNGPAADSYPSAGEYSEGDATRAPAPATLLHTDSTRREQFFVMQGFDSWVGGNEEWFLKEVWGNWQTDSDPTVNMDGERTFHLS